MSVDKFKFVSPGVFIDEIDESGIPALPERMGPLVIGRFQKGPGKRPVRVNSYKEFTQIFGEPAPGNASGDIWRTGEMTAPTYAAYAVKAWLRNNAPCTVYRVLGENSSDAGSDQDANAGWRTDTVFANSVTDPGGYGHVGGGYGLFVFPSASMSAPVVGTLAAVWYLQNGSIELSGTLRGDELSGSAAIAAGSLINASTNLQFTAHIKNSSGSITKTSKFDFDRDSQSFIRKAFNTDPTKTNSDLVRSPSTTLNYWLGETFESNVRNAENSKLKLSSSGSAVADNAGFYGVILALDGTGAALSKNVVWGNRLQAARSAETGYFISQDTRGDTTAGFDPSVHTEKLFKFVALDSGEHANRDYKVSITNIRVPANNFDQFGTFTVQVRKASDNDNSPVVLEQFSGVNLDPTSANYIGRVIGDRFYTYDSVNKRIIEHGDNDNRSKILYVDCAPIVKNGEARNLNPYGVYGPSVPITHTLSDQTNTATVIAAGSGSGANALPGGSIYTNHPSGRVIYSGRAGANLCGFTGSVEFPTTRLRVSSSEGDLVLPSKSYFGYQSNIVGTKRFDQTNIDLLRGQPSTLDPTAVTSDIQQNSWVFTLDDIRQSESNPTHSEYVSGSRAGGSSWTAKSGSAFVLTGSAAGFSKFTSPMFGGFDGFDATEKDPLRNSKIASSPTEVNDTIFYSLKKAIDVTSDADFLEYDLAVMPGITNTSLNTQLINACEERADSLAIVDLEGGYVPPHENTLAETANVGDVETTVIKLKDLNINSSYGAAFYPWVKIRDTAANSMLYVPPSVVALGTFSSAQRKSAVWFAPAGFTRGGLSEGSAGLPVVGVRQRLTSAERDRLYDANINPIASFPSEGIVIFGQKTLQVTRSALDRINVRRLLIFVKKEISRIASRVLFDQNIQSTWDRFTGQVIPFLEGVQSGAGLMDFRVLLDDTTTTPDLIDRNILYAKIFLKPARAVEFIALDFIITRSGASFDD
jgi:hypothetical protein